MLYIMLTAFQILFTLYNNPKIATTISNITIFALVPFQEAESPNKR